MKSSNLQLDPKPAVSCHTLVFVLFAGMTLLAFIAVFKMEDDVRALREAAPLDRTAVETRLYDCRKHEALAVITYRDFDVVEIDCKY